MRDSTSVDVTGQIELEHEEQIVTITASGDQIVAVAPSDDLALRLLSLGTGSGRDRRLKLRSFAATLAQNGVTLDLQSDGRRLARIGRQAQNWWLSLIGWPHTECRFKVLMWSLFEKQPTSIS